MPYSAPTASRYREFNPAWEAGSPFGDDADDFSDVSQGMKDAAHAVAATCIGTPAALAKAYFGAANESEKSWGSRVYNGIMGVGFAALTAFGSLVTIGAQLVIGLPYLAMGAAVGAAIGTVVSLACPLAAPAAILGGMSAGAAGGLMMLASNLLPAVIAGARKEYRERTAQALPRGRSYFPTTYD